MRLSAFSSKRRNFAKEPAGRLREIAREFENELARITAQRSILEKRAAEAEASAMKAVRADDDRAARAALLEQWASTTELAQLEADAHVLRSLLDEVREFLSDQRGSVAP